MALRQKGSLLQGHPDMKKCPGIDMSTGSLGRDYRVFAIVGDGELDEGQSWEAFMSAQKNKLDNLVVFLGNNGLQGDNTCEEVMPHLDVTKKLEALGFACYDIDGNNMRKVLDVLDKVRNSTDGRPKFINATQARAPPLWKTGATGIPGFPQTQNTSRPSRNWRRKFNHEGR